MEVTIAAFLFAERDMEVDHFLERDKFKGKRPSEKVKN